MASSRFAWPTCLRRIYGSLSREITRPNWLRCGRDHLNITCGWIRTRLFGVTSLRRSAPTSISKFFGARFQSPQTPPRFPHGCRIFILTRKSSDTLTQSLIGEGTPISVLEPLVAGGMQYRLSSGTELSLGLGSRRGCLLGEQWDCLTMLSMRWLSGTN